ncbi:hypothetical protein Nepgr_029545 [Nepenthes gracilis]|uniref:Uncharacterized protein n=1 Tax=Nepenthes gracilis TaxID=150966 RepID=A0AAD3Y338_NEPGR|nr:hypothetical protein Nepgr_029545 [Nepenthes gracilis]
MASSRMARFATEVAPPQFVGVVRRRASKMLDTIHEEEREGSASDYISTDPNTCSRASAPPLLPSETPFSKRFLQGIQSIRFLDTLKVIAFT